MRAGIEQQVTKTIAVGTVTALSADGITVGDLSCPIRATFYPLVSRLAHVGDKVNIGCRNDTGLLSSISSAR
jgi:hypothetical protein